MGHDVAGAQLEGAQRARRGCRCRGLPERALERDLHQRLLAAVGQVRGELAEPRAGLPYDGAPGVGLHEQVGPQLLQGRVQRHFLEIHISTIACIGLSRGAPVHRRP